MSLKDKVAIVAGGGRDIGRACAVDLAEKGAKVVVTYHASADSAKEAVTQIRGNGGKLLLCRLTLP